MPATTTQGGSATVRRFAELLHAGRMDDALALLHEDFVVHEPPGLPYGGEYHGPEGFRELVSRVFAFRMHPVGGQRWIEDAGDRVVCNAVCRFTSPTSGAVVDMPVAELYSFRDGRIIELDVFYKDPAAISRLAED